MLVLRESSQNLSAQSDEGLRVKEYSAWAQKIRREGLLVDGEKLKDEARFLNVIAGRAVISETSSDPSEKAIGGYFLIRARDYQEAITIAQDCPHLKYGGTIEIRQIDSISK